jgi:lipopolysaccharide/colanic/teichoic acid biosynthesis glycosyltransferase
MVPDAELRLDELEAANQRSGPLFKMRDDPRITRVGRLLRESSLDELPQLINVLRGEMSLVGPRPALPKEIEKFDDDLRQRAKVRPGLTGLWQVEARDNPSFDAYRRLDLYYVENWSLSLDFVILIATAEHVATRLLSAVLGRRRGEDSAQPLT